MINVEKIIQEIPLLDVFCSFDKLYDLVDNLKLDQRFTIETLATSKEGLPIYHVKFGSGATKALIVAGVHSDEPIGNSTVYSLLMLLKENNQALTDLDLTWSFVPCIDPDAAKLNEKWTQERFSFS